MSEVPPYSELALSSGLSRSEKSCSPGQASTGSEDSESAEIQGWSGQAAFPNSKLEDRYFQTEAHPARGLPAPWTLRLASRALAQFSSKNRDLDSCISLFRWPGPHPLAGALVLNSFAFPQQRRKQTLYGRSRPGPGHRCQHRQLQPCVHITLVAEGLVLEFQPEGKHAANPQACT